LGKGKLIKMFPGGNTAYGFYSFYDHIIEPDATHIFVIKGGPGVGKSTFMRKIGETMRERGYDTEGKRLRYRIPLLFLGQRLPGRSRHSGHPGRPSRRYLPTRGRPENPRSSGRNYPSRRPLE